MYLLPLRCAQPGLKNVRSCRRSRCLWCILIWTMNGPTGSSHPTIKSPEQGLEILARFASDFVPPTAHEGYDRCLHLQPDQTRASYSRTDIENILERVRTSEPPSDASSSIASRSLTSRPRGSRPYPEYGHRVLRGGSGGYRGRGRRGNPSTHFTTVNRERERPPQNVSSNTSTVLQSQTHVLEPAGRTQVADSGLGGEVRGDASGQ